MRRRLRRQRQMREALLLDLGALVFELHRQGRREPELLQAKAAELTAVDEEVRALAVALETDQSVMHLVATGIAGSCESCGALLSVDARFCSSCGAAAVPALSTDGEPAAFPAAGNGAEAPAEKDAPAEGARAETAAFEAADIATGEGPVSAEETGPEQPASDRATSEEAEAEPEPETAAGEQAEHGEPAPEEAPSEAEAPEPALEEEAPEEVAPQEEAVPPPTAPPEEVPEEVAPTPTAAETATANADAGAADGDRPSGEGPHDEGRPAGGPAPRALADDALDSAGRAIRAGIARGRRWIRSQRARS